MQQNNDLKVLHLTLMGKWYDMISSGAKKEEYREIKPYWQKRLMQCYRNCSDEPHSCMEHLDLPWLGSIKHFDVVCFHRGYTDTKMLFKLQRITIGKGNPAWGAPKYEVFILKLGEKLK